MPEKMFMSGTGASDTTRAAPGASPEAQEESGSALIDLVPRIVARHRARVAWDRHARACHMCWTAVELNLPPDQMCVIGHRLAARAA